MNPALILLPYFNRPKLLRNALLSVKNLDDPNWVLAFIDDASPTEEGLDVLKEILGDEILQGKVRIYRVSREEKVSLNWTTPPRYMNKAIRETESDLVMILCDDDALLPDYLTRCREYFYVTNPQAIYGYSSLIPFYPPEETPGPHLPIRDFWTNHEVDACPVNNIDASQVVWVRYVQLERGIWFAENRQFDHDAGLWEAMWHQGYGLCPFMGFFGQYKAFHPKQLTHLKGVTDFQISRDV